MDEKVKAELLNIRASGICNMLDLPFVQRVAFDRNYYDLVNFISEHRNEYIHFIFYGDDAEASK